MSTPFAAQRTARLPRPWIDGALEAAGNALARRRDVVRIVQWIFVAIYLFLLLAPLLTPLAPAHAQWFPRLATMAEALFWGIWWPAVLLSVMVFGQFWCGLFCPDGTLTEEASRRGLALKIPAGMRHGALPLGLFAVLALIEQLSGARHSHAGTVLLLGTVSISAIATGFLYGRGKRVWCRYLCPTESIFSLLSRCAVLHFKVDRATWDAAPRPVPKPVDCPPLLDIRRLTSNEKCSMCGRCSGHRDAVKLSLRSPGHEIALLRDDQARIWEAGGIVFVLVGLLYGLIYGAHGPWHDPIATALPSTWPGVIGDLMSTLAVAAALGGGVAALLLAAARGRRATACRLAYGLIPLAGVGLVLSALEHSFDLLMRSGWLDDANTIFWVRAVLLLIAVPWSAWLGRLLLGESRQPRLTHLIYLGAALLLASAYLLAPVAPR